MLGSIGTTLARIAVMTVAAATLAACSASDQGAAPAPATTTAETARPVLDRNFPDPDLLKVGDTYYAYATNDNNRNVQVATSTDLQEWEYIEEDALPMLPEWVIPGKTWAPEVTQLAPKKFALYFTATNFDPALQCIGVATASEPAGPFIVQGREMLVCPEDEGGAIDAGTYKDGNRLHLVWKNDGNCCGFDTWLQTAPLSGDGLSLTGPPRKLIKQSLEWEGDLIEAPTLMLHENRFLLFYSSNSYGGDRYNVGYAEAASLNGPWKKKPEPLLSTESSDGRYLGPGGQDVVTGPDGKSYLVFHGWDEVYSYRGMYVEPINLDARPPTVGTNE